MIHLAILPCLYADRGRTLIGALARTGGRPSPRRWRGEQGEEGRSLHLSNADIARFLAQLPRYRHVLMVNDVRPSSPSAPTIDIPTGRYRPIDLTQPPFSLAGTKVLAWHDRRTGTSKLVIHLERK